jgi:hypothetical protein
VKLEGIVEEKCWKREENRISYKQNVHGRKQVEEEKL